MTIELNLWEAKLVLEAMQALDAQWNAAIDGTEDEDVQADYGNDLAQMQMLWERVEGEGCKAFGPEVKEFSREAVGAVAKDSAGGSTILPKRDAGYFADA